MYFWLFVKLQNIIFDSQRNCADHPPAELTQSARFSTGSQRALAWQLIPAHLCQVADMNANPMESVDLKNIAATGNARRLVGSAERARLVLEFPTTVRYASAPRTTSDHRTPNADLNVTVMLIVPDLNQLATTVSARILATTLAVSAQTATCVD